MRNIQVMYYKWLCMIKKPHMDWEASCWNGLVVQSESSFRNNYEKVIVVFASEERWPVVTARDGHRDGLWLMMWRDLEDFKSMTPKIIWLKSQSIKISSPFHQECHYPAISITIWNCGNSSFLWLNKHATHTHRESLKEILMTKDGVT